MKAPVAVGYLLLAGLGCASASPKATVNLQRAAMECRDGRAARAALSEIHRASQEALDRRGDELRAKLIQIREDRARGEDVREREAALRREMEEVSAEYRRLQKELSAEEERRAAPIYARLREALPQLAAAHHVDKIAEAPPASGASGQAKDLTAELIRAVDAQPPLPPPSGR